MKKFNYIIAILFAISFIISCESELEIDPRQSISETSATSTPENIEAILIGGYGSARGSFNGALNITSDLLGNTNQVNWNGTFANWSEMYNKEMTATNVEAYNIYRDGYNVIGDANIVLDNLSLFTDTSRRNNVEGQAKFLRGITLFNLVRLYGKPYVNGGANNQLGVSIITTPPSIEIKQPRNTVQECYTQILSDLNDAYNMLPTSNGVYADKYSAKAILARVYLQMQDHANARDAANDVIENSGNSLMATYSDVFSTDINNAEYIFSWIVTEQESSNASVTHYASQALGGRGGDISVTNDYVALFDATSDDRASYFYMNGGERLTSKYTLQYANTQMVRLSEMYLIRAETNLREGTSVGDTPINDVNKIRSRSNAPNLTSISIPLVLKERQLELAFEGFFLHDAKRTMSNVGSLPYDSDKLVLPIPIRAIDANDLLKQNPGYSN